MGTTSPLENHLGVLYLLSNVVDDDQLSVNLGKWVDYLVNAPINNLVNPISSTISKWSLFNKLDKELNNLIPKLFSSKITFIMIIMYFLIGSNNLHAFDYLE